MGNKISSSLIISYLNIRTFFCFILLFCIMFTSCNNLPADLQSRKDACNAKLNELSSRDKNASSSDYKQLMHDYGTLKDEVISYTVECNKRGISKENEKLISELNEKISKYKGLSNSDNGISSPSVGTSEENKSSFGNKITSGVYESDENGLKTYLRFEGSDGSQGMFGSLTLSNNASSCKYVYTYNISGSNIKANFYGSDCGANSSDQTFTYNENLNTISCYINGQKFVFKSIY